MIMKREEGLFERDEKEQLLPVEVKLTLLKKTKMVDGKEVIIKEAPTVKLIPMPRGKWVKVSKLKEDEQEKIVLEEHLVEPKYTWEERETKMKPMFMPAVMSAITAITLDISLNKTNEATKKELTEAEEMALKKKLKNQNNDSPSSSMSKDTTSSTLGN